MDQQKPQGEKLENISDGMRNETQHIVFVGYAKAMCRGNSLSSKCIH